MSSMSCAFWAISLELGFLLFGGYFSFAIIPNDSLNATSH